MLMISTGVDERAPDAPADVPSRRAAHLGALLLVCLLPALAGCWRTPATICHATAADLGIEHPQALQAKMTGLPRVFTVNGEPAWQEFWGAGEEPPKVNFQKERVLAAYVCLGSEGPGTLEVWALKYRETEQAMEVRVKQLVHGEWPQGVGYARAYDVVRIPKRDKPVKIQWQLKWGNRNELHEIPVEEWRPQAAQDASSASPGAASGWENVVQPH